MSWLTVRKFLLISKGAKAFRRRFDLKFPLARPVFMVDEALDALPDVDLFIVVF